LPYPGYFPMGMLFLRFESALTTLELILELPLCD
jgi:hypothetical protein